VDVAPLVDLVQSRHGEYLAELEAMVNVDCGSYTVAGVNAIADRCAERFDSSGWTVDRRPHVPVGDEPRLGDLVIGSLDGRGGTDILLVGHMDTVFDEGVAAERPFRVEDGRAYGPGVSDMKGGLLTGFFAIHALHDAGFDGFGRLTYVCNPDEEIGSPFSGPVLRELAPQHDVAFVLEGARENGDIVSARKGISDFEVTFAGRAAHAGVEPERGRHAVLAASHAVIGLQALNGRWPGVTVNVGVVRGGTRTNVVPDRCTVQIDVRSPDHGTLEEAEREVERICAEPHVPDVTSEVRANGWHRPMEKTAGSQRLVDLAVGIADQLGFPLRDCATGGASDANTTSSAGTPTIDGLGPIGGDDHGPAEWLDVTSVVPRTALLAALLARA
jgi:glutamate carboxypeptidase